MTTMRNECNVKYKMDLMQNENEYPKLATVMFVSQLELVQRSTYLKAYAKIS